MKWGETALPVFGKPTPRQAVGLLTVFVGLQFVFDQYPGARR